MTEYVVEWSARAIQDLLALSDWLTDEAGAQVAGDYTDNIESHASRLREFPIAARRAMTWNQAFVPSRVLDGL